jgi:hypothetical protein
LIVRSTPAGYPGSEVVPAVSAPLSLLILFSLNLWSVSLLIATLQLLVGRSRRAKIASEATTPAAKTAQSTEALNASGSPLSATVTGA